MLLNKLALSTQTITALETANITLKSILEMDTLDDFVCKNIGPKRLSELKVFRMMNKLEPQAISAADIAGVRSHFTTQKVADYLANPKTYKYFRLVHKEFLTNNALDKEIAKAFSMFRGTDLMSKRIGELINAMPRYAHIGELTDYNMRMAYFSLVSTIFNGLTETKVLNEVDVQKPYIGKDGRRYFRTERNVEYDGDNNRVKDPMYGVHSEPGKRCTNRIKVKPGGTPYKYNSVYKSFLKTVSSQALELVEISEEEFTAAAKEGEWYTTESKNFHRILKNELIKDNYITYQAMLGRDLYLSMWGDYRWRNYYDFNNFLFGPHTKNGKYMYQATEAKHPSEAGYGVYLQHAVTLAGGKRVNIAQGAELWAKNKKRYTTELLKEDQAFGDKLYRRRLVQAIADWEAGIPSKFLVAGDNTNGGLQILSAEFRIEKAGKACNIGGLTEPQDSHQPTATAFGIPRKMAKEEVNQAVLHGGAYSSMAKKLTELTAAMDEVETMNLTPLQVEEFLVEAFGPEITNIVTFQDFARKMYDNYNSSSKFTSIDGLPSQSIAFVEGMELKVWGLATNEVGVRSITVNSDMPLVLTNTKKEVVYSPSKKTRAKGERREASTKMSGTFANVTHTVDGWSMRQILTRVINAGYAGLNVHDMYLYQADAFVEEILPQYTENLVTIREYQPFTTAAAQINENRVGTKFTLPDFKMGNATEASIRASHNHITA